MLSTTDTANYFVIVSRKVKKDGKWGSVNVRKPSVIERYNKYMNTVDKSDQLLGKYNLLIKCVRWWKIIFFHMIDIASVNAFILFKFYQSQNPDNHLLKRLCKFSLLEFREELIRPDGFTRI